MDDAATIMDQVVAALHTVVDPCGLFNRSHITIGELGMYRRITVSDDVLEIELFLDDPSCSFAGQIMLDIRRAIAGIARGREIRMPIVHDEAWDAERITEAGQRKLAAARAAFSQSLSTPR